MAVLMAQMKRFAFEKNVLLQRYFLKVFQVSCCVSQARDGVGTVKLGAEPTTPQEFGRQASVGQVWVC